MIEKKRKIKFYFLSMEKRADGKVLSTADVEAKFQEVVEHHMIQIKNTGRKAAKLDSKDSSYVIELIKQNDHVAYLKLGIQNPANSVALRDKTTLEADDLSVDPLQELEIDTFGIIDFKTQIVSYVSMNGSPRVSVIKDWLNRIYLSQGYAVTLATIYSPDVLHALSRKKRITKLELDIALPADQELENLGVSSRAFDNMGGRLTRTVSFIMKADRGKSLFEEPGKIETAINNIVGYAENDTINCFTACGKDDDDSSPQTFNLLDYGATVNEKISASNYDRGDDDKKIEIIYNAYNSKKEELLSYVKSLS